MFKPKLTVGMAVVEDYKGVYTTIQHSRLTNLNRDEIEFIVVDNRPGTEQSAAIQNYLANQVPGSLYYPMHEPKGTSPPRNKVFELASSENVVCLDSHVLTDVKSLDLLINWYDQHPDTKDLFSGPILYDDLMTSDTHFNDHWRDGMWGTWGRAWKCNCDLPNCSYFTPVEMDKATAYESLSMDPVLLSKCAGCGKPFPEHSTVPFARIKKELPKYGYTELGTKGYEVPFEIPGQGLGLFSCKKDAWLGFNEHFREFGGEEMYIHEKYRKNGRKCYNLPFLKWNHDFGYGKKNYFSALWGKVRNYVLGHQELGLPLDRLYDHFVVGKWFSSPEIRKSNVMDEKDWNYLLIDPISHSENPHIKHKKKGCKNCGNKHTLPQPSDAITNLDGMQKWLRSNPRGVGNFTDVIAEYAAKVDTVLEISKTRETVIPLLNCKKHVQSFTFTPDPLQDRLLTLFPEKLSIQRGNADNILSIPNVDLLLIQGLARADAIHNSLTRLSPAVSRYIIVPFTKAFAEFGETTNPNEAHPGLLPGLRRFMAENPKWSIIYHSVEGLGLSILGCRPEDKPKLPGLITMASNFAVSLAKHVADDAKKSLPMVMQNRLEICSMCPQRVDDRCATCGCYLAEKASWNSSECPLGYWPK